MGALVPRLLLGLSVAGASTAALSVLNEAAPSSDVAYLPIGGALLAGALLTARVPPGRSSASFVAIPALVAYARFGPSALPAMAYASLVANLVHGARRAALLCAVALDGLAFAAAVALARASMLDPVPAAAVFAASFVGLRFGLWQLSIRAGVMHATPARVDQPGLLVPLAMAPLGALPLLIGNRLGDGGLLLTLAGILSLLVLVRDAANLASARAMAQTELDRLARANALHDELLNLITHELKNPLTTVRAYAQLGQRALKAQKLDDLPEFFTYIERAERSINRLVDNLLQLSKLEQDGWLPPPELVDVVELSYQVVEDLEPIAEHKHQILSVDAPRDLPHAWAQPLLLREALSNLVSNAVKYTLDGGHVVVAAHAGDEPGFLELCVTDSGIGISEADMQRLFTRFFRSSDPRAVRERGTGLGLALTHAIVERMGGHILVDSQLDVGTTFRVVLPIATDESTRDPVTARGHAFASAH